MTPIYVGENGQAGGRLTGMQTGSRSSQSQARHLSRVKNRPQALEVSGPLLAGTGTKSTLAAMPACLN